MKLVLLGLGFSCALLLALAPRAYAADFYVGLVNAESDDPTVEIIDPAAIGPRQNDHKVAHLTNVYEFDEWSDRTVEMDCTAYRWRVLQSVIYDDDNATPTVRSRNDTPGDWETFDTDSNAAHITDMVCLYPDTLPTGDDVMIGSDLPDAIARASETLSQLVDENEKK